MSQYPHPSQQPRDFSNAGLEALFDFNFSRFLTLNVMKGLYFFGLVLIALFWLMAVVTGFTQSAGAGVVTFMFGSLVAILYVIFLRVSLELIVVIFRIGENTARIAQQQGAEPESTPPSA